MFKSTNRKSLVVIIVFVLVLIFAVYTWYGVVSQGNKLQMNEALWYSDITLSQTVLQNWYDLAFEQIILVAGLAFSALAFWLKLSEKK